MNTDDEFYAKYLRAEGGRQYLLAKVEDLEKEISELQAKIHELMHRVHQAQGQSEYWQNLHARQS